MTPRTWTWRHAILKSTLSSTTKHVLLTISCYMNEVGEGCYPTIDALVGATGLSTRAIIKHIGIAQELGWLDVKKHGFKGRSWKNNEYSPTWPDLIESLEQPAPKTRKTRAKSAKDDDDDEGTVEGETLFDAIQHQKRGSASGALPQSDKSSDEVVHLVPRGSAPDDIEVVHQVHPNIPESFQYPSIARERAGGGFGFQDLWDACPDGSRPENRGHAEALFSKLTEDDRAIALSAWPAYRKTCIARSKPTLMISYLKQRLFRVYDGAPPIDRDGDFRITPDRPEWPAWLEHRQRTFGAMGRHRAERDGFVISQDRWPPEAATTGETP